MCWWVVPGFELQNGLRPLASVKDVIELINIFSNSDEVHFYIEQPIDEPTIFEDGAESSP